MTQTTKQSLINYLEFLKQSGFVYLEGELPEFDRLALAQAAQPKAPVPLPQRPSAPASRETTWGSVRPPAAEAKPARQAVSLTAAAAAPAVTPTGKLPPPSVFEPIPPGAVLPLEERNARIAEARNRAELCRVCPLGDLRDKLVYSDGPPDAKILFVGEAPGADENATGRPFVGRAGQLLDKMLTAIGIQREEVFICNTLKCRPPENRDPSPAEKAACEHFLIEQIAIIRPQIIVALGAHAAQYLCRSGLGIGQLRERWYSYDGIPLRCTYHPSFLLKRERMPDGKTFKIKSWDDFQAVHAKYCELNPRDQREIWTKKG